MQFDVHDGGRHGVRLWRNAEFGGAQTCEPIWHEHPTSATCWRTDMRFKGQLLGAAVAALSGCMALNAQAQALPSAVLSTTGTGMNVSYKDGAAQVSFDGFGPTPTPPLYDQTPTTGSGSVAYWIEVLGPGHVLVPVHFNATGAVGFAVGWLGKETVTASWGSNPALYAYTAARGGPPNPLGPPQTSFAGSFDYNVMTNTPILVELSATWIAGGLGDGYYGGGETTGYVDSCVAMSSSWDQVGFTLVSSGSAMAVPEPGTYVLMFVGSILAFAVRAVAARVGSRAR
jgi:hypothetical protein